MSQALGPPARVVKAVDIDMSPQRANALANKVFHTRADFRVESVEDVSQVAGLSASVDDQLQPNSVDLTEDVDKKQAAHMRMWWDEAMARHMVLSEGYSHVSVLIIKWADYLDDLNTKKEVCMKDPKTRPLQTLTINRHKNSSKYFASAFDTKPRPSSST